MELSTTEMFPAIDLRGGRCVRLIRGERDAEIHYDDDPLAVARRWRAAGARCLHVIDLGAAFGEPSSRAVTLAIAAELDVPIQAGGGLRDDAAVGELLDGGVDRVLLGTRAFRDPEFLARMVGEHGAERIVVCMDCDGDRVKVAGWEEESDFDVDAALEYVARAGADRLLVTATDRDGTLSGPRLDLTRRVLDGSTARVVAAGGIGTLADVRALLELGHPRLEGIVLGRALYEGTVRLEDALALVDRGNDNNEPSSNQGGHHEGAR